MIDAEKYVGKNIKACFNMGARVYTVNGLLNEVNKESETVIFEGASLDILEGGHTTYSAYGRIEIDSGNLVAVVTRPEPDERENGRVTVPSKKDTVTINLPDGSIPRPTIKLRREPI